MQCWEREDGRKLQRVDSELDEQWSRAPGKDPRHSSWLGPLNLDHKAQGFSGLFIYKPRGDTLLAVSGRKAVCFKVTCISKMWTLHETLNDINVWAGCVGGGGGRKLSTLKFRMTIWIWSYRTGLFPPPFPPPPLIWAFCVFWPPPSQQHCFQIKSCTKYNPAWMGPCLQQNVNRETSFQDRQTPQRGPRGQFVKTFHG